MARKELKCSPGNFQCGGRCQNSSRNCPSNKDETAQKSASELSDLINRVATGKGSKKDNETAKDRDIKKAVNKQKKKLESGDKPKTPKSTKKTKKPKKTAKDKEIDASQAPQSPGGALKSNRKTETKPKNSNVEKKNQSEAIDVSATTVENKTSTNAEIRNENLRRRANQLSDVAQSLFKAAAPTPKAGETQTEAVVKSVARNAARAKAGPDIAGTVGKAATRRAIADTKTVLDALSRFRNRKK